VPGGFSYGDYLRCGAIARFSPVMQAVKQFADNGGLVLGICNGFQVLTEAGLLPGALIRNRDLQFHCETFFSRPPRPIRRSRAKFRREKSSACPSPTAKAAILPTRKRSRSSRPTTRFCGSTATRSGNLTDTANPNGAVLNIAGICNEKRNVAGLMPHPERACETLLGSDDGKWIFESIFAALKNKTVAHVA
jgi:phosphoribosylformylglycinamidine synthase I